MSEQSQEMKSGPTRRRILQSAAGLGAAAVLPQAASVSEAFAQGAGDTLVIAAPATPQSLDNEFDVSLGTIDALAALYEYMLDYEKIPDPAASGVRREDTSVHPETPSKLALKGRLAEQWEMTPDGRKATFKLREGIVSNWGNKFTAKDVKWTWDRKFHLKGQGIFLTGVLGLKSPDQIRIEGDHAISFNLDQPNPLLMKLQCNLANPIYDATKCAQVGGSDDPWATNFLKNESAGFGPYRVSQMIRGQQAVFTARDDYWDAKPAMKRVIMREVPQSASRFSLLQGGAVDIAQFLQPRELEALKTQKTVGIDAVSSSYMIWIELNAKIAPFDNVDIRRAVNLAIPREEIIRTIYYGYAEPQTAPMPAIYPMADKSFFTYNYNIEKAKALLAKAGVGTGLHTTLSYNAGDPTQEPIALLIQTSMRQIGIELTLEKLPAGVFYDNVSKRAKPMIFYLDSPWTPDPGYSTYLYFNSKSYENYSNYVNTSVDAMMTAGLATLDNAVRKTDYAQVQKTLMDEAPWGFIAYPKYTLARRANLKGFTYYTSNNLRFQDFTRA